MYRPALKLIANHMDAWGLTFAIGMLALLLHNHFSPQAVMLVVCITFCYWLGFALNDYYDADQDRLDQRKAGRNYFVQSQAGSRWLWIIGSVIMAGVFVFFTTFGWRGILIYALGCFAMWAYSAPPLRLKSRPVADLIVHALFVETFPYFVVVILLQLQPLPIDGAMLSFFFLASLSAQLEQQARDYDLDRRMDQNFTTHFGLPTTVTLMRVFTALLILTVLVNISAGVIPAYMLPLGWICLPVLLHRFFRAGHQPRSEILVRFSLAVGLLYTSVALAQRLLIA